MAGVASDQSSFGFLRALESFYDTRQENVAAHSLANQPEPPPRVLTVVPHVPELGEVPAVTALPPTASCPSDVSLSQWLGSRLPARAVLTSSHAPLPSLFPSRCASTLPSQSRLATAAAALRPRSPFTDMEAEGNGAGTLGCKAFASSGRVAAPLAAPPSPCAASAAAPAGEVVAAPDSDVHLEASPPACSPSSRHHPLAPPPTRRWELCKSHAQARMTRRWRVGAVSTTRRREAPAAMHR